MKHVVPGQLRRMHYLTGVSRFVIVLKKESILHFYGPGTTQLPGWTCLMSDKTAVYIADDTLRYHSDLIA